MINRISENFIFHFTERENLLSILEEGFRWSKEKKEDIPYQKDFKNSVVLTGQQIYRICFCDLPIRLTQNHRKRYGGYAIGLKKEWAYRKQISPVKYVHSNTRLITNMKQYPDLAYRLSEAEGDSKLFLRNLYATWKEKNELDDEDICTITKREEKLSKVLTQLLSYISLDVVPFIRDEEFYDEREWRAVLETRDLGLKEDNLICSFSDIAVVLVPYNEDKQYFFEKMRDVEKKFANGTYSNHITDEEIMNKIKTYEEVSHDN
ncbi:abortive infection system antitoxin AbiGi family protein [Candidatus Margulisiibacteriota bacterium]